MALSLSLKYALVLTALLASVTIAAGRQPLFKSGVEVVYLDVTVQAPDGSIVRDLGKDDFLIYDEEVPQDVAVFSAEPAPISVGVLIDTSGSMTGERMAAATRAADALGRSLQPGDQWSISTFDSTRRTMITWRPYSPGIVNSLRAMPTSGSTELFRAVTDMVPYMKETPHRKRAMLLMTDGIDNSIIAASRDGRGDPFEAPGPLESSAKAQAALREGEVLLYALGVNVAGRAGAVHVPSLQRLAEPTGGSVIISSTIREVEAAAQRVADFFAPQITLNINPPGIFLDEISRAEIAQQVGILRSHPEIGSFKLTFLDPVITLGADQRSAIVEVTMNAEADEERHLAVQEVRLTMREIDGDWVICRIETVRTLNQRRSPRDAAGYSTA